MPKAKKCQTCGRHIKSWNDRDFRHHSEICKIYFPKIEQLPDGTIKCHLCSRIFSKMVSSYRHLSTVHYKGMMSNRRTNESSEPQPSPSPSSTSSPSPPPTPDPKPIFVTIKNPKKVTNFACSPMYPGAIFQEAMACFDQTNNTQAEATEGSSLNLLVSNPRTISHEKTVEDNMDELFASPSGSTRDDLHTQENEETPENPTTSPTTVNQAPKTPTWVQDEDGPGFRNLSTTFEGENSDRNGQEKELKFKVFRCKVCKSKFPALEYHINHYIIKHIDTTYELWE